MNVHVQGKAQLANDLNTFDVLCSSGKGEKEKRGGEGFFLLFFSILSIVIWGP